MKRLCILGLIGLLSIFNATAGEIDLHFVRDGKAVKLPEDLAASLLTDILTLYKTTGYQSHDSIATEHNWNRAARRTYFLVKYESPTPIEFRSWEPIEITQLLIPLADPEDPDHLFARNNGRYWAHTKYDPSTFADLICRPELKLTKYDSYCRGLSRKDE